MDNDKIEFFTAHGIDWDDALDRFAGNAALYEKLAKRYVDDKHVENLERALAEADIETAYAEAHALKGVSGNLSFAVLFEHAKTASDALKAGDIETAKSALPSIKEAHAEAIAGISIFSEDQN